MPLPRQPLVIFKVSVVVAAALELLVGAVDELLLGAAELTADELDGKTLASDELLSEEELISATLELLEVTAVLELLAGFDPPPPLPPQAIRLRDKKVKHKS